MRKWTIILEGRERDLELLAEIYEGCDWLQVWRDERGWCLWSASFDAGIGNSFGRAITAMEQFLWVATGALQLFAGSSGPPIRATTFSHSDPETGKSESLSPSIGRVVAPFTPEELTEPVEKAPHKSRGSYLIAGACRNDKVMQLLSLVASGTLWWWQVYIIIEIMLDIYGGWAPAAEAVGISTSDLKRLKRTANYFRHTDQTLPPKPWKLVDAGNLLRSWMRQWILEELEDPAPNPE